MKTSQKTSLFLLRISMGWLMFYAGVTKLLDSQWSASGYLEHALTFQGFFQWFTQPGILPVVNFINEWSLTLLGISLILGIFVRFSSFLGVLLMMLYYFPVLDFPRIAPHSYLIDEHIIYALVLLLFGYIRAGRVWGIDARLAKFKFFKRYSKLRNVLM